jgi:hypothetical protein
LLPFQQPLLQSNLKDDVSGDRVAAVAIGPMPFAAAIVLWHIQEAEANMRNFHLPLPEQTYALLRAEAQRTQLPTTTLAREAIDAWLRDQARKARYDAIAAYASETAGTNLDLDPALESAGIEHLVKAGRVPK